MWRYIYVPLFLRLCVLLYSLLFLFIPIFLLFSVSHFPYLLSPFVFFMPFFLNLFLCFILHVLSCFPSLILYLFPSFIPLSFHSLHCLCQVPSRFIKLLYNRTLTYNCTLDWKRRLKFSPNVVRLHVRTME